MSKTYTCPMHPEVISALPAGKAGKPGRCPKCGMSLVKKEETRSRSKLAVYKPLFIIIGLIFSTTLVVVFKDLTSGQFTFERAMTNFMAGFFLVFSGFKLLDLKGFAEGYSTYDLLATKVYSYGFIYPFLELFFGLSYLTDFVPNFTNLAVLTVMSFSGVGVVKRVLEKRKFQCVCLGTIIKVPLTTVTIVEDFGMAGMALILLIV